MNIIFTPGEDFVNLRDRATFNLVASRVAQAATLKAEKTGGTVVDLEAARLAARPTSGSNSGSSSGSGTETGGNGSSGYSSGNGSSGSGSGSTPDPNPGNTNTGGGGEDEPGGDDH